MYNRILCLPTHHCRDVDGAEELGPFVPSPAALELCYRLVRRLPPPLVPADPTRLLFRFSLASMPALAPEAEIAVVAALTSACGSAASYARASFSASLYVMLSSAKIRDFIVLLDKPVTN
ncbi:unnamed protein product [Arctia plantaginis]|uniref:Uncharacterized protein n=1 Tax=Arctia plantaginis TaxID=874455 RepID=A0A8S1A289_ARCPL|nr:unnamed protein product [Arctia plantaginis]